MHGAKSGEPAKILGEGSGRVSNEGEKQMTREQDRTYRDSALVPMKSTPDLVPDPQGGQKLLW